MRQAAFSHTVRLQKMENYLGEELLSVRRDAQLALAKASENYAEHLGLQIQGAAAAAAKESS